MKVLCWGAIVDNENNSWMHIYNTDVLIKGGNIGSYEYIGNLNFRSCGINDKCILKALEVNDHVILFARASYDVWIIDKITNKISQHRYYDGVKGGIADIVQCGENAVILPYSSNSSIVIWNMCSHDVDILQCEDIPLINHFAFIRGVENDGFVYSATRSLNEIYVCRVDVNGKRTLFIKTPLRMINAIDVKDDGIWLFGLASDNKTVFQKYKKDMSELLEEHHIEDIAPVLENGNMIYFRMCVYKNKIFLIPSSPERVYVYNLKMDCGYFIEYPDDDSNDKVSKVACFVEIQQRESDVFLFPYGVDRTMKLNLEDGIISDIKLSFDSETERLVNENIILSSDILREDYLMSLSEFFEVI